MSHQWAEPSSDGRTRPIGYPNTIETIVGKSILRLIMPSVSFKVSLRGRLVALIFGTSVSTSFATRFAHTWQCVAQVGEGSKS